MDKCVHCRAFIQFRIIIILVFCLVLGYVQSSNPSLRITPHHLKVDHGDIAAVMCRLDRQIVACQFHLNHDATTIMDFSAGAGASTPGNKSWYDGSGLEAGECGIKIPHASLRDVTEALVLGCRVRAERTGWMYADMTLYVVDHDKHSSRKLYDVVDTNYPDQVIVEKSGTLQVAYRLKSPVTDASASCTFDIPGVDLNVNPSMTRNANIRDYVAESSQCGIQITHVNVNNTGWMWTKMKTKTSQHSLPFPKTTIIVAQVAENTDMRMRGQSVRFHSSLTYDEGEVLSASCHASSSRPVSNLTWFFGDDVIRNDDDDDTPVSADDKWRWDYDEQSIMQNITRKIVWMDDGKELICQITHLAYGDDADNGVNESMIIEVNHAKWGIVPTELLFEDLTVGRPGVLVVYTDRWSMARPTFLWRVKNITLREDEMDENYDFHATKAVQENGKWVATLVIMSVTAEDMKYSYLLIAGDENERREYLVTVTTVDLKLWYFFITLFSGVALVLAVLGLIYNRDIRHWMSDPRRSNDGRMMYTSANREEEEQHF